MVKILVVVGLAALMQIATAQQDNLGSCSDIGSECGEQANTECIPNRLNRAKRGLGHFGAGIGGGFGGFGGYGGGHYRGHGYSNGYGIGGYPGFHGGRKVHRGVHHGPAKVHHGAAAALPGDDEGIAHGYGGKTYETVVLPSEYHGKTKAPDTHGSTVQLPTTQEHHARDIHTQTKQDRVKDHYYDHEYNHHEYQKQTHVVNRNINHINTHTVHDHNRHHHTHNKHLHNHKHNHVQTITNHHFKQIPVHTESHSRTDKVNKFSHNYKTSSAGSEVKYHKNGYGKGAHHAQARTGLPIEGVCVCKPGYNLQEGQCVSA